MIAMYLSLIKRKGFYFWKPLRAFANPTWHSARLYLDRSAIIPLFSFAPIFANGWFTACDSFYGASAYWLSESYETINHYHYGYLRLRTWKKPSEKCL